MLRRFSLRALTEPATLALASGTIGLLLWLLLQPVATALERALYDRAQARSGSASAAHLLTLSWPAERPRDSGAYRALLEILTQAEPRAIVLMEPPPAAITPESGIAPPDGLYDALLAWDAELRDRAGPDQPAVADLLQRWQALGFPQRWIPQRRSSVAPAADGNALTDLLNTAGPVIVAGAPRAGTPASGIDAIQADADGILRREPEHDRTQPPSLLRLAGAAFSEPSAVPDTAWRPRFVASSTVLSPRPVDEVLEGRLPAEALHDRLIIVGGAPDAPPVQLPHGPVTPAEALAQRIAAAADGQTVRTSPAGSALLWLAAVAGLAIAATLSRHRRQARTAFLALALAALLPLLGFLLLRHGNLWLDGTGPALWLLLSAAALAALSRWQGLRHDTAGQPARLGRYQVESELGRGAMGVVYLGQDPRIGRRVALKTLALPPDLAGADATAVKQRFFDEAAAAGRLSHPHIVQIYDAGEDRGVAFIAMELIEGHDLSRHTHRYSLLPVDEVIGHLADAAEALDYAHRQGVIHRDVKPANLLRVAASGQIRLTDFGLAGAVEAGGTMTYGSPAYMSPEQLAGKALDGRADLYALGVTGYQLLTGTLPFRADTLPGLMRRIATEDAPPPSQIRRDLPPAVDTVIGRLLHKQPAQRYASGTQAAAALRAVATHG